MRPRADPSRWFVRSGLARPLAVAVGALLAMAGITSGVIGLRAGRQGGETSMAGGSGGLYRSDAWTAFGGEWAAEAGEISNSSTERGAKLMLRLAEGTYKSDYEVQADMRLSEPFGEAGLMLRSSEEEEGVDAYRGYFAGIRPMDRSLELGRSDFGWHLLARSRIPPGANLLGKLHVRLIAVGCALGVEVTFEGGGRTGLVARDPECLRSGRFGLRSQGTRTTWSAVRISKADEDSLAGIRTETLNAVFPAGSA